METGTLFIRKTKKGFQAEIHFTKNSGKQGVLPVTGWSPNDDSLNDTKCEFERVRGTLIKLISHDKKVLYALNRGTADKDLNSPGLNCEDSFQPKSTLLPIDTQEALKGINPDNFLLKWQKGARYSDRSSKNPFAFFYTEKGTVKFQIQPNFGDIDFKKLAERELKNAKDLLGASKVRSVEFKTSWRLVQGLGMESVYEVSMTLHHVYGIPYIPSSALKGIVRSWIIKQVFNCKEEQAIQNKLFCDWFGCPGELILERKNNRLKYHSYYKNAQQGKLVFFDVYPTVKPTLKTDVMNPHYADYYQDNTNKKPPADYYNPVPIYFLTIEDTSFQFVFGGFEHGVLNSLLEGKTIEDWTKDALINHGIGAKTAVGYGYMNA